MHLENNIAKTYKNPYWPNIDKALILRIAIVQTIISFQCRHIMTLKFKLNSEKIKNIMCSQLPQSGPLRKIWSTTKTQFKVLTSDILEMQKMCLQGSPELQNKKRTSEIIRGIILRCEIFKYSHKQERRCEIVKYFRKPGHTYRWIRMIRNIKIVTCCFHNWMYAWVVKMADRRE